MKIPQKNKVSIYKKALEQVVASGAVVTDDCQILEMAGYSVYTVVGNYDNLKITTADDVILAELLLKGEEKHD